MSQKVQYDDQAGEKHNELALEFLNSNFVGSELEPMDVYEWADKKHHVDLNQASGYLFKTQDLNSLYSSARVSANQAIVDAYEAFDPYVYLNSDEHSDNDYFKVLLKAVLSLTDSVSNDAEEMVFIIDDFSEGIKYDSLLNDREKEILLSSLDVYHSSIELWNTVDSIVLEQNPNLRAQWGPRDYWKVPVTDWIGGLAGSLPGPAGVLVGGASTSLITWVTGQRRVRLDRGLKFSRSTS